MTRQEIFDKVATHLLTQNKKAVDKTGSCMYRAPDGSKCAAGCLIEDDEYSVDMENRKIRSIMGGGRYGKEGGPCPRALVGADWHTKNLVDDLQDVHDLHYPEEWMAQLEHIARRYSLDTAMLRVRFENGHTVSTYRQS